jgi:hypothetical protein
VARNLLYFLTGSVGSATQLYWIDSAADVQNATWEDYNTLGRKFRDQILNESSFFVKDDWKILPSLTLNLGLRWEYYGVPYIGSGFTTTAPGQGLGLFGVGRTGRGTADPFNAWLVAQNGIYLNGYGTSGALACNVGTPSGVAGIPASNCDPNLITSVEFVGPNSPNPSKSVYRMTEITSDPRLVSPGSCPSGTKLARPQCVAAIRSRTADRVATALLPTAS